MIRDKKDSLVNPLVLPTVYNHFITVPESSSTTVDAYFCRRDTPFIKNKPSNNLKLKSMIPIAKSIMNYEGNQLVTQISTYGRPEHESLNLSKNCLGYLEVTDFNEKSVRYLEIPRPVNSDGNRESWNSFSHLNISNETEFLVELSPTKNGNLYTLDFYGNLNEWETGTMNLKRSLDDWQKLVMRRESEKLSIDVFNQSPNTELKEFKGPKHGKVDETNAPHHGGNTWAGNLLLKLVLFKN